MGQRSFNRFLLELQLRLIAHVLPLAAAAGTKVLTERCSTILRSCFQLSDLSLAEVFLFSVYANIGNIARDGFVDEKHKIVGFAYALALFGDINNGYIFEQQVN